MNWIKSVCLSLIFVNLHINSFINGQTWEKTILYDPMQGGVQDPGWIFTGAYSLSWFNANACPRGDDTWPQCVLLYGVQNGGSTLTNRFTNIASYHRIGIYYFLTVSQLPATTSCRVQYRYGEGTTTWVDVASYTSTEINVKYAAGWWLATPSVPADVIYIRFWIDSPTDSSRCYLNNFYFFADLPDVPPPPITTATPPHIEQILFYNTLHDGDVDDQWRFIGSYEQSFSNDNQAPSGRYHVVLYGAPNGGSKLQRVFMNMNQYTGIKINYGLAVYNLDDGTYCRVQYSFDDGKWIDLISYTTTTPNVVNKHPNQFESIPTPPFGTLFVRFYIDSSTDASRCNLNNFILYGTPSDTLAPTPQPSEPAPVEEIIFYNTLQAGDVDDGWVWSGEYDQSFSNSNQAPSGRYHVVIYGASDGGSSLQHSWTNMNGYTGIKINYGLAVGNLDDGTYCYVQYSHDDGDWINLESYTSTTTGVVNKYPNQIESIPTPPFGTLSVRFYIDSTSSSSRCNLNNFILFGTPSDTLAPTPPPSPPTTASPTSPTASPVPVEEIIFQNTLQAGDVDAQWVWSGNYDDRFSNSNQSPSGSYHVVLYGAPNGGSSLQREFNNIDEYMNIKIGYDLSVYNLDDGTYCRSQYSSDGSIWIDVMSYTTSTQGVVAKYPNELKLIISTPTSSTLFVRFHIDASTTSSRCNLNNFILFGTR